MLMSRVRLCRQLTSSWDPAGRPVERAGRDEVDDGVGHDAGGLDVGDEADAREATLDAFDDPSAGTAVHGDARTLGVELEVHHAAVGVDGAPVFLDEERRGKAEFGDREARPEAPVSSSLVNRGALDATHQL